MSNKVKDFLLVTLFIVVMSIIMGGCIYHATSPEVWYAGKHDADCENTLYGEKCHCYERFIEADKERVGK